MGLYGVIAYIVLRRRKEVGIRIALGATRPIIINLFLKEAGILIALGIVIGLGGSVAFARAASALLFGVSPRDTLGYTLAAALLASVAFLASYLPARRAAALAPLIALREE